MKNLFREGIATVLVVSMAFVEPFTIQASPLFGQITSSCPACQDFNAAEKLPSKVVENAAIRDLSLVRKKFEAGTLRAEDVRAAVTSSRTYFAHLEEIGFNAVADSKFKDPSVQKQILEFTPTDEEIGLVSEKLSREGTVTISKEEVKRRFSLSYGERRRLLDEFNNVGVAGIQARIIQSLANLETRTALFSASEKALKPVRLLTSKAPAVLSAPTPEVDLCGWLEFIGYGFAFLCLLGCFPCCGAALVMEIYAWLCEHGLLVV